MDESTRQRLMDLLAALGLAPGYGQIGAGSPSLMQAYGQMGQTGAAQGAANLQGIASLADLARKMGWI
jgi:hypothetical protein